MIKPKYALQHIYNKNCNFTYIFFNSDRKLLCLNFTYLQLSILFMVFCDPANAKVKKGKVVSDMHTCRSGTFVYMPYLFLDKTGEEGGGVERAHLPKLE